MVIEKYKKETADNPAINIYNKYYKRSSECYIINEWKDFYSINFLIHLSKLKQSLNSMNISLIVDFVYDFYANYILRLSKVLGRVFHQYNITIIKIGSHFIRRNTLNITIYHRYVGKISSMCTFY